MLQEASPVDADVTEGKYQTFLERAAHYQQIHFHFFICGHSMYKIFWSVECYVEWKIDFKTIVKATSLMLRNIFPKSILKLHYVLVRES